MAVGAHRGVLDIGGDGLAVYALLELGGFLVVAGAVALRIS